MKRVFVSPQDAHAVTKWLIGFFMGIGGLMQIPQVNSLVTPFLAAHPRLAPTFSCFVAIGLLLHNPLVQQQLGMTQQSKETLPDGTEVEKTSSVTITAPQDAQK